MARVVVIGAGLGGLATAIWLADFGHEVTVYEQLDEPGGRLRSARHHGHNIELAPGPITLPAVLRDLFRKTGRPLDKVVDLAPADPAFTYQFPDGTRLHLPATGRAGITHALDEAFGCGSGAAWHEVVDYGGRVWAALRPSFLTATPTPRQRTELRRSRQLRRAFGLDQTLRALGERHLPEPLRAVLEHRVAGADPRTAPAGLAAIAYVHQTFGRWRVAGGTSRLIDALHNRALEHGVTVTAGTAVTAIAIASRRVTGVRLSTGAQVSADIVVSAVDRAHLTGALLRRRAMSQPAPGPSPGIFNLALGLDSPAGAHPAHTVLLSADPDAVLDAIHCTHTLPEHPTIDMHLGPDGHQVAVTALVPPYHATALDWTAPGTASAFAERLLNELAQHGVDLRDRISWRAMRTPADVARETNADGGAAFGPAVSSLRDVLARDNRTKVRGLFLAGSSAYPGPGVPLVGLSAAMVADLIGRA